MHVAAQSMYTAEKRARAIDLQHNRASLLVCVRDMEIYWGRRLLLCASALRVVMTPRREMCCTRLAPAGACP